MKKILALATTLIMLFMSVGLCYANSTYEIDVITGEVVSTIAGDEIISESSRISNDCIYNKNRGMFTYYLTSSAENTLLSSVYNGEIVTGKVNIESATLASVTIYKDGEEVDSDNGSYTLIDTGSYAVKNESNGETVLSFTILNSITNISYNYTAPSVFTIQKATLNGEKIYPTNGYYDTSAEGEYIFSYNNSSYGYSRTVTFTVDHTPPVLEIYGLTDGVAKNPVTFGPLEENSTLTLLLDGDETRVKEEYTTAGTYHVTYTDEAGNETTCDFVIRVFLNINAGIVLGVIAAVIIAIIVYMIYLRKNMKTF